MNFTRVRLLGGLLLVLLVMNGVIYWPKKEAGQRAGPPPGMPGQMAGNPPAPSAEMQKRMEERLQKMTPEERRAFEARREADRTFFESVKNLTELERRVKMQEYFAKNPPPVPPGGREKQASSDANGPAAADGAASGKGPGGGGPHVPPANVRRGLDQQIANSQGASS